MTITIYSCRISQVIAQIVTKYIPVIAAEMMHCKAHHQV
jgi:hypothetical protein